MPFEILDNYFTLSVLHDNGIEWCYHSKLDDNCTGPAHDYTVIEFWSHIPTGHWETYMGTFSQLPMIIKNKFANEFSHLLKSLKKPKPKTFTDKIIEAF